MTPSVPPSLPPSPPGSPWRAFARFVLFVALLGSGFAALRWTPLAGMMNERALVETMERVRGVWWAPAAHVASFALLCPFGVPATPMLLAGGIVFGTAAGTLYNLIGTFLAAALSYVLARTLARDLVAHLLGARLVRIERAVARSGFLNLVRLRFLPLPFAVVNYGAALAGVRPGAYLTSALPGLIVPSFLFAYFADSLFRTAADQRQGMALRLGLATALLLALTFVPNAVIGWRRRRRYRDIRARRRRRMVD